MAPDDGEWFQAAHVRCAGVVGAASRLSSLNSYPHSGSRRTATGKMPSAPGVLVTLRQRSLTWARTVKCRYAVGPGER